jgi:DNA-binding NarL/FixJ family response regulator
VVPIAPAGQVIEAFEDAFPSRPVLVVSGYVDEELTRNGIEQGRYQLLRKPFPPEELCRAIDELRAQVSLVSNNRTSQ